MWYFGGCFESRLVFASSCGRPVAGALTNYYFLTNSYLSAFSRGWQATGCLSSCFSQWKVRIPDGVMVLAQSPSWIWGRRKIHTIASQFNCSSGRHLNFIAAPCWTQYVRARFASCCVAQLIGAQMWGNPFYLFPTTNLNLDWDTHSIYHEQFMALLKQLTDSVMIFEAPTTHNL